TSYLVLFGVSSWFDAKLLWLPVFVAFAVGIPTAFAWGAQRLAQWLQPRPESRDAVLGLLAFCLAFFGVPLSLLIVPATPSSAFAAYLWTSVWLFRTTGKPQISLAQAFWVTVWFGGYFAMWRQALQLMLIEYSELSIKPMRDDCYVATAAANGHARFVGAKSTVFANGETAPVNDQPRHLKCGELALKAAAPRLHRLIRRAYDFLGPRLAKRLAHPILADLAYLALKPAEWLVRATLHVLLPDLSFFVRRIYPERGEHER
ncbi:MAG: hypothetical protein N2C14_20900, partial [Planctomycetales bacterium]